MSGEVEQREALAAFIDQAEMGHIPGANVTEHWTDRVAYAVMHSDWLRDYVAARVASAAAENAALRARIEVMAEEFERDNEHSCFKPWCPDCREVKLRRWVAAALRAVLEPHTTRDAGED